MAALIFALILMTGVPVFLEVATTDLSCHLCLLASTCGWWLVGFLVAVGPEVLGDDSPL